jgi:hypothetical protein
MHDNLDFELIVAREKRHDLLYQAEQDRLIRLAKKGRKSGVKAGHRSWDSLSIRGMWHKVVAQAVVRESQCKQSRLTSHHS